VECTQNATVRSSVDAPEIVSHDVKHTRINMKLATFWTHVDEYGRMAPK